MNESATVEEPAHPDKPQRLWRQDPEVLPPDGIELEQVRRFQPSFGCAASYAYRGSPHRSDALLPRAQRPTTRFVAFVNCEAAGLQEHRPHAASWWADLLRSSTKRLLAQVLRLGLATAKNSKGVEGRRRHAPSREGRERLCPFRPAQSRDPQGSLVGSVLASNFLQLFRIYDVPGDLAEGLGDDLKTRPLAKVSNDISRRQLLLYGHNRHPEILPSAPPS